MQDDAGDRVGVAFESVQESEFAVGTSAVGEVSLLVVVRGPAFNFSSTRERNYKTTV